MSQFLYLFISGGVSSYGFFRVSIWVPSFPSFLLSVFPCEMFVDDGGGRVHLYPNGVWEGVLRLVGAEVSDTVSLFFPLPTIDLRYCTVHDKVDTE